MKHLRDFSSKIFKNLDSIEPPETPTTATTSATTHNEVRLSSLLEELDSLLAHKNVFTDLLKKVERSTTITSRVQVLAVVILVLFYLVQVYTAALLCNILTLLLPMFASITAIENPGFESDTKWLMYWVVFSCVNFLEMFISWIPSYNLVKFLVLAWCMAPGRFNGSGFMYFKFIRPLFLKHRQYVNGVISIAAKRVTQAADNNIDDFLIARTSNLLQATGSLNEGQKKDD